MRLQFADPADHPHLGSLPFATDLEAWELPHMHGVLGLHRHVVRLVELGVDGDRTSYVVKELPDHLARREYRLQRRRSRRRCVFIMVQSRGPEPDLRVNDSGASRSGGAARGCSMSESWRSSARTEMWISRMERASDARRETNARANATRAGGSHPW